MRSSTGWSRLSPAAGARGEAGAEDSLRCRGQTACECTQNRRAGALSYCRSCRRGTSAEYLFYTTLTMMLRQVIRWVGPSSSIGIESSITVTANVNHIHVFNTCSNSSNPTTQREELQRIYQWFCINKPLIAAVSATQGGWVFRLLHSCCSHCRRRTRRHKSRP